ncbi:calcium-independent phospholipase A2-gamma-like [Paramisgurnus dabryanus]|uniref:calcium-independent phospholipase A2-gamma-like n=1 Tax=Paramisgurnus dabryanus TaxID=90735 RepID=UPI0031F3F606
MRYLLTNIRHLSHLERSLFSMRLHRSYLSIYSSAQYSRRNLLKPHRSKKRNFSISPIRIFGPIAKNMKYENEQNLQMFRLYSTSSREEYKAEAPIGVLQNSRTSLRMNLWKMRFGESFSRLSSHINLYFKPKQDVLIHEPLTRIRRQVLRDTRFIGSPVHKQASSNQSGGSTLNSSYPGPQLFHISSLATRFGESYTYVANHINSMFSRSPAKQIHVMASSEDVFKRSRNRKRRIKGNKNALCQDNKQPLQNQSIPTRTSAAEVHNNNISSSWEEGYLHFARHINRYFGAKVADTAEESQTQVHKSSVFSLERTQDLKSPPQPKSPGLFHMSSLTTRFGENYTYMAKHINRYFKGSTATEDEEIHTEYFGSSLECSVTLEKQVSFFECLLKPSAIPSLMGNYLGMSSRSDQTTAEARIPETMMYKTTLGRRKAEEITKDLLNSLQEAMVPSSITSCVEELNSHLIKHPACKAVVWQDKAVLQLLRRRRIFWMNEKLQEAIRETLALIGYVDPVKGCGIRVLSIDGGGTKGIVPLQVLKQLESQTGKRVYQLFDYICGVSTGAVLAFMLGLVRIPLDDCEEMYHRFGSDVFRQNPLIGTVKMGWTHSYYNTETWEMILREEIGEEILIKTARDELSPKVSAVSAVVNWGRSPKAFIFRNYNHAPHRLSRYPGGSGYRLWQAVRASSAAPGYFQEFPLYGDIHQDGGLILNNPCALAVHESRLLWPNQPFQCVLSLGTGRYDDDRRGPATSTSLRDKISNLIWSATDTEGVHTLLDDLLSPNVYFRFNPMLSLDVTLDERRPEVLQQMRKDTQLYLDRNQPKLERLSKVLMTERTAIWKTRDWIGEKAWELQQRWA